LKRKNICLVDDIKTTGATLNECAKTLKEAGAAKVYTLVLAVAGQNI
jgi:predicted amidophosphoribosyltransferase